jgi:hypothetical protein
MKSPKIFRSSLNPPSAAQSQPTLWENSNFFFVDLRVKSHGQNEANGQNRVSVQTGLGFGSASETPRVFRRCARRGATPSLTMKIFRRSFAISLMRVEQARACVLVQGQEEEDFSLSNGHIRPENFLPSCEEDEKNFLRKTFFSPLVLELMTATETFTSSCYGHESIKAIHRN